MRYLQAEVSSWQKKTFGTNRSHVKGLIRHLKKEVNEEVIIAKTKKQMQEELADCIILLIGIADAYKIDLEFAVQKKMSENLNREWKKANKYGVIEHKK
jgi:NTP pyrophosphatase (non-canonical NTP hydrolase)